ncbi:MAG: HAMP domain-containing histidine kinase [Gemmatimonadaceae bacterium]|nr:HAMP domain-containing histidine kinase [Gemmatimonadaceae bacterium]
MTPAAQSTLSIRARLALWYAGSALVLFLVFAITLRGTVRATLRREFTSGITSSASAIQSFYRIEQIEYGDVPATITHIANEVVFPDRIVEFLKPDGTLAFRVGRDPALPPAAGDSSRTLVAPLRRVELPLDPASAPGWRLRVFASAAPLERSLGRIDSWMLFGIPLGVLLAGATGWWLAGRTLRPVGAMAEAATRMASDRRDRLDRAPQRLPIDNPSDELGRLGLRFNALLDEVDGLLSQQRRFLADAAHELRTPVARMLGTVDLSLLDSTDAPTQHEALVRVRRDLDRTARLVDELLQLARADAAGIVHPEPAYLDDIVMDAVHVFQPLAETLGVRLLFSTLEEAPVRIDRVQVDRLVGILLDNAIRYTKAPGDVTVSVSRTPGAVELAVSDTGIGIPPAERARIFERFYRGAGARAMSPEGSGLGLAIADWIARAHGAVLELQSVESGGTKAVVTFRTAEPAAARVASAGHAPTVSAVRP